MANIKLTKSTTNIVVQPLTVSRGVLAFASADEAALSHWNARMGATSALQFGHHVIIICNLQFGHYVTASCIALALRVDGESTPEVYSRGIQPFCDSHRALGAANGD